MEVRRAERVEGCVMRWRRGEKRDVVLLWDSQIGVGRQILYDEVFMCPTGDKVQCGC